MKHHILLAVLILVACVALAYHANLATVGQAQAQRGAEPSRKIAEPCKAKLADGIPTISFAKAREAFLNQGYSIRSATLVNRASDLIGSIMSFGGDGKWLFVTVAELRYDPERKILAYSRLEGFLHDGTQVKIDKTDVIPSTFRVIDNWNEVGPVVLRDIDGKMREKPNLEFEITSEGRLVTREDNPSINLGGPCRSGGAVNCLDFCWGNCRVLGSPPDCRCETFLGGFCLVAVGLHCGGDCPSDANCTVVSPHPGSIFCGCAVLLTQ